MFTPKQFLKLSLLSCAFVFNTWAEEPAKKAELPPPPSNPVVPVPRDRDYPWMSLERWNKMHTDLCNIAAKGETDLIFLGDSITEGAGGSAVWKKTFGVYRYAIFGIGGDRTQNILWRLDNGETGTLKPKTVVLLIGTNNLWTTPDDLTTIVNGVTAVVGKVRNVFPTAHVLVLGVFPRAEKADEPVRTTIRQINAELAKLDNGQTVLVRDIGSVFLEPDGTLSKTVSGDALHLTEEGYRRWAEAIAPIVQQWMK